MAFASRNAIRPRKNATTISGQMELTNVEVSVEYCGNLAPCNSGNSNVAGVIGYQTLYKIATAKTTSASAPACQLLSAWPNFLKSESKRPMDVLEINTKS